MPNTRPDTSTVIPDGQRLVLNRERIRALADHADARLQDNAGVYAWAYSAAVRDTLRWLAGDDPTDSLALTLDLEV